MRDIRQRCEAATAGPWVASAYEITANGVWVCDLYARDPAITEFIAHAREDIPRLLARIDELEAGILEWWEARKVASSSDRSGADVFVLGRDETGRAYVASSSESVAEAVLMIEEAKFELMRIIAPLHEEFHDD